MTVQGHVEHLKGHPFPLHFLTALQTKAKFDLYVWAVYSCSLASFFSLFGDFRSPEKEKVCEKLVMGLGTYKVGE